MESAHETDTSVCRWAEETFGTIGSTMRTAARANEEMAELLRALSVDDNHPKAAEECADIVIILCRVAERLGTKLWDAVEKKMAINRQRVWNLDGTGHGYHVRPGSAAELRAALTGDHQGAEDDA